MTNLLSQAEAFALTEPLHQVWADAHRHAWGMWQERLAADPEWFKPFTPGDRYLMLHRHITEYAARHLEGQVQHAPHLDFFAQIVGGRALVRFKHLHRDYTPRNYPTDQQSQLDHQEFSDRMVENLALDGFAPVLTVLTVGYMLSIGEDELTQVGVVCRAPELRYWYSILDEAGEGTGDEVETLNIPGMDPPGPRVISKRPAKKPRDGEQ